MPGLAPTPGVSRRTDAASGVKRILVVHMVRTDETFRLAANNVPLEQRTVVLKQVGVSFDEIMRSGDGQLTTAVVVWVARRLAGERSLSWAQFLRAWPTDLEVDDAEAWIEDPQGRRLDEDGNVIVDPDAEVDAEVDGFGDPVDVVEVSDPAGVDDPQS